MLTVNNKISIPLRELRFSYARSPGPGGQNVNKVNTKAILKWSVETTKSLPENVKRRFLERYRRRISKTGELVLQSHRFRDQGRNTADCLAKLREMILEVAKVPKVRKVTKPSLASKRRRLDSKKRTSQRKASRRGPRMDD